MLYKLITYDLAQLLKDNNFTEKTDRYWANYYRGFPYTKWKIIEFGELQTDINAISNRPCEFPCPTQSEVQTWLREKHNIQVYAYSNTKNASSKFVDWIYTIHTPEIRVLFDSPSGFSSYEYALEVGLTEAIEMIKK